LSSKIEWIPLRDLLPGFVFVTERGTLAVKSEYHLTGGKCMCILLQSGEYAHFEHGDDTLVRVVELKEMEMTPTIDTSIVLIQFGELLTELKSRKPNDRSEQDRYWAIVITDVEKALGTFNTFVHEDYNNR
jgi:hypothetical protein